MKLAAIVIVYYPNIEDLKINIFSFIEDIDKLIIWDNTPAKDQSHFNLDFPEIRNKTLVFTTGKNEFIAYPLNEAINWCLENGYNYLLSMDQDSLFENGSFRRYVNKIKLNQDFKIAIFGVNPNGQFLTRESFLETNWFITSGSIYDVSIIKKIGGFREDYQIDCVDNEICYKVITNGYKVVVDTHCKMNQIYGSPLKSKYGFTTSGYSPFRTYSILCNHILLWREYPNMLDRNLKRTILKDYLIYRFVKIILAEDKKKKKLLALFNGLIDGLKGKRQQKFVG
ncbi:hypothetical protein AAEO57_02485 [Flavobacterium sp. DGU38]|uniref:Rhamnosyltransferase n=1 Tax=Flavobacterium calami TaxID=3139144 RepID=A0ABU9IJL5_9FLAO